MPKKSFKVVLNSFDVNSWTGTNIFNCQYDINLNKIIDDPDDFLKPYNVTVSILSGVRTSSAGDNVSIKTSIIYPLSLTFSYQAMNTLVSSMGGLAVADNVIAQRNITNILNVKQNIYANSVAETTLDNGFGCVDTDNARFS